MQHKLEAMARAIYNEFPLPPDADKRAKQMEFCMKLARAALAALK